MRIAVVIATTGRADLLEHTVPVWTFQTRAYDRLVISVPSQDDVGLGARAVRAVEVVEGPKGLPAQRNRALDHLAGDCDVVVFADDDYVPTRSFIELCADILAQDPDIAILTGHVVADGINTAGISFEEGVEIVRRIDAKPKPSPLQPIIPAAHAYGCNMVVRVSAAPELRFDERLPLYGWLEDLDYSRRMKAHGRCMRSMDVLGVHLGTKRGRTSGVKLGYSQVANPLYFVGKGTLGLPEGVYHVARNMSANMVKSLRPEPWTDRAGRLKGNFLAVADLVTGRMRPEKILEL